MKCGLSLVAKSESSLIVTSHYKRTLAGWDWSRLEMLVNFRTGQIYENKMVDKTENHTTWAVGDKESKNVF